MAPLIDLDELKIRLGIDATDTRWDTELGLVGDAATASIISFTERDFASPQVTEERTFQYDGSGYLDIDDASAVTAATLAVQNFPDQPLTTDQWVPQPSRRDDAPVYTYLLVPGIRGNVIGSPEMGFARNVDIVAREGRLTTPPPTIKVTGTWGWPDVPDDVKQAYVWTVEEFRPESGGEAENLTSEAISGYARSWAQRTARLALPNRARDLLSMYTRVNV